MDGGLLERAWGLRLRPVVESQLQPKAVIRSYASDRAGSTAGFRAQGWSVSINHPPAHWFSLEARRMAPAMPRAKAIAALYSVLPSGP